MSDYVRGYSQFSKAWYSFINIERRWLDQFMIGLYHKDGDAKYEFAIRYYESSTSGIDCKVEMYDEAFKAFGEFKDLFRVLELNDYISPNELVDMLAVLEIEDLTETERES